MIQLGPSYFKKPTVGSRQPYFGFSLLHNSLSRSSLATSTANNPSKPQTTTL